MRAYRPAAGEPLNAEAYARWVKRMYAEIGHAKRVLTGQESLRFKTGTTDAANGIVLGVHNTLDASEYASTRWVVPTYEHLLVANIANLDWAVAAARHDSTFSEIALPAACPALNARVWKVRVALWVPNTAAIQNPQTGGAGGADTIVFRSKTGGVVRSDVWAPPKGHTFTSGGNHCEFRHFEMSNYWDGAAYANAFEYRLGTAAVPAATYMQVRIMAWGL